ncbi:hypothetical protein OHA19_03275 [Streptomyces sp. NBC_00012]|uniref:hypothetical protein n=1 Tax=Streptomyces sp. NBC_00012 TaxID=2975621 RepID=UPI0032452E50
MNHWAEAARHGASGPPVSPPHAVQHQPAQPDQSGHVVERGPTGTDHWHTIETGTGTALDA